MEPVCRRGCGREEIDHFAKSQEHPISGNCRLNSDKQPAIGCQFARCDIGKKKVDSRSTVPGTRKNKAVLLEKVPVYFSWLSALVCAQHAWAGSGCGPIRTPLAGRNPPLLPKQTPAHQVRTSVRDFPSCRPNYPPVRNGPARTPEYLISEIAGAIAEEQGEC
jgi:hypothetical protein